MHSFRRTSLTLAALFTISTALLPAFAQHRLHNQAASQSQGDIASRPWMDRSLSPGQRADLVLKQLTLDEKISLVHDNGMPGWGNPRPNAYLGNGGAGFVLGVLRLGIPINMGARLFLRERGRGG